MTKIAVLAGGCFWGMEDLIRSLKGVVNTEVGYAGGENDNPTYENHDGHAEAVQIEYDDEIIDYRHILDFFFQIHNPTTLNQQGNDKGTSYRSAIFFAGSEEKMMAAEMIEIVNESARWPNSVVTTLEPLTRFWPAEAYHQDYLEKNPGGYTCHAVYFDSYL
ncbi:MAG: S-isomer-specific methionine sulfoxide reductase [Candidatus Parcubacteria bacterium]|jgi:peptide-methionine (S)-S-oxide reductase